MTSVVSTDPTALRTFAAELATAAGTLARARRDEGMSISTKSSATDLVTEHDRAAEELLVETVHARRPGDGVIGEEGANHAGTTGYRWIVDPIDGTTNFVYRHPLWATSVAVADADGVVAGAVYAPDLDDLFTAARGHGASLNGAPITASTTTDLAMALVATGFGYRPEQRRREAQWLAVLIDQVRDVRRGGSAALDLCYAAAGHVDGYYEHQLNVWDIAAGELIAREAGCISTGPSSELPDPHDLCVAAPGVFDALREALTRARMSASSSQSR